MGCEKSLQGFIVGDRIRVNSGITRRVGNVVDILENGHLVVRFPFGYKKNSSCFRSSCLNQPAVGAFVCMIVHLPIIRRVFAAFVCQNKLLEFT